MKKTIPLTIGFIISVIWFGEFFLTGLFYQFWKDFFTNGFKIMGGIGIIVGVYSILNVNINKIRYNRDRWFSILQLSMIVFMIILGIYGGVKAGSPFGAMFTYVYIPINATIFSLLAFYIASAAFRSFRAKNMESALLLIAAALIMLSRIPLGEQISDYIPLLSGWVMDSMVSAGRRAIMFGAGLGGLTMMIRVFFGLERSHISDK